MSMQIIDFSKQENKETLHYGWGGLTASLTWDLTEERETGSYLEGPGIREFQTNPKAHLIHSCQITWHWSSALIGMLELRLLLDEIRAVTGFSWISLLWLLRRDIFFKHLLCRKMSATISHSFNKVTVIKGGATCIALYRQQYVLGRRNKHDCRKYRIFKHCVGRTEYSLSDKGVRYMRNDNIYLQITNNALQTSTVEVKVKCRTVAKSRPYKMNHELGLFTHFKKVFFSDLQTQNSCWKPARPVKNSIKHVKSNWPQVVFPTGVELVTKVLVDGA